MRLAITFLGLDILGVDITTDATSPAPDDDDYSRDLSGGSTGCTPIGFVATYDQPDEVGLPDRYGEE